MLVLFPQTSTPFGQFKKIGEIEYKEECENPPKLELLFRSKIKLYESFLAGYEARARKEGDASPKEYDEVHKCFELFFDLLLDREEMKSGMK